MLLRSEYADSPEFRERLRREGRHAALLSHPGVVQVHDYVDGSADGVAYLVMEYVAGPSLAMVLAAEGTLSPGRVLDLIVQAAEALARLRHRQGDRCGADDPYWPADRHPGLPVTGSCAAGSGWAAVA
jgi:serine/threonine protein kinase